MNCANHVEVPAVAYCRTCGKPMCSVCTRDVRGVIYCEECLASQVSGTMPPPPAPGTSVAGGAPTASAGSPGVAALLGFIPGVGAFYNGQYGKGFIHVLIFGTLIWAAGNVNGIFGLGIAAFALYMPFEAYQTAKAKQMGVPPPDPFGFNSVNLFDKAGQTVASGVPQETTPDGQPVPEEAYQGRTRAPVGALVLIGLGVLFLLNQFDWFRFDWMGRLWPLILIAIGVAVLMKRTGREW